MGFSHIATAPTTPLLESLDEARLVVDRDLTVDEYALARVIGSEHFSGSAVELLCIGDACVNRANDARRSIFDDVTRGNGFGAQGEGTPRRPVSSARPPAPRHVHAALALLRRPSFLGLRLPLMPAPARGIARGARRFFDPKAQLALSKRDDGRHCPPLVILERWTFDLQWADRAACKLAMQRGKAQEEWVGPIPGVDPYELMLFRPATLLQSVQYAEAKRVIESGGKYKGAVGGELVSLAVLGAGAALAARAIGAA